MTTSVNFFPEDGDKPDGRFLHDVDGFVLDIDRRHGDYSLIGDLSNEHARYLRRLAAEADKLADAIDARLSKQVTTFRITEVTTGETRDVPTPGATT